MWPGTRGLKGLGCKVKDGPTHPKPTLKVGPLQLFPTPRPGGRPRYTAFKTAAHPPTLQKELACALQCQQQNWHAHRPAIHRATRCSSRHQVRCGGHAEDRRQAASSQRMEPYWTPSLHGGRHQAAPQACQNKPVVVAAKENFPKHAFDAKCAKLHTNGAGWQPSDNFRFILHRWFACNEIFFECDTT